jgi:hypothetical protein
MGRAGPVSAHQRRGAGSALMVRVISNAMLNGGVIPLERALRIGTEVA